MPLQKQNISFPMLQGVDQKSSEPLSEPGSVEDAQNVVFTKTGQINKRKGFDVFRSDTDTVGDRGGLLPQIVAVTKVGRRLHKFKDSLLFADGQMLYSKVGSNDMKPVEDLLDCTYSNDIMFTPNNQKVGRVNLIRKTVNSVDYDIFSYVQTVPTGSSATSKYQVMMAVKEVASGAFFRQPTVIHEVTRQSGSSTFYQEISSMPSVHMVEDSNSNVYIVFSDTNVSGSNIAIKFTRFSFSGSIPAITSPSFFTLKDNGGTNLSIHARAPSIAVEVNSDNTAMYVAYYKSSSNTITGNCTISRYAFSGFTGTLTSTVDSAASSTGSGATEIDTNCEGYGSGLFPAVALRFDPADTDSGFPLMVAFNQATPGGKGSAEQKVFFRFFKEDGTTTKGEITNANFAEKYLVNATQSYVSSSQAHVFFTLADNGTDGTPAEQGGGSAFYKDSTNSYGGVKTVAVAGTIAATAKEGFITVRPLLTISATNTPEFGSASLLYVKHPGNGSGGSGTEAITVSVVEPGAGFTAGTSETDFKTQIDAFFGITLGGSNTVTITIDEDNDNLRCKNHEVVFLISDRSTTTSSYESISKNASLISDSFREFISTDTVSEATGFGTKTYVNISRTNGNDGNFNSCNYLIDTSGKLIASGVPGQSSLNYTSDYRSIYQNHFRLFDGVARVSAPGKTTKTAARYIFGSNMLTASGNTYTDAENNSALDTVDTDQFYALSRVELVLDTDRSLPAVDVGNQLLIGGGSLFSFDGETLVENGFYEFPSIRSLVAIPTNSASRLTASKTYNYSFTYEFIDSFNNIHESVTTPLRQIDTTASLTAVCARVYACDATLKRGSVRVTMYRSTPAGDGPLIKKVKTAVLDASQRHFTFLDFGEDQEEFDRAPVIYTTGGVLDNNQPGSITDIVEHKGRVFLATTTEFIRFSKPLQQAFAPGFPVPAFVIDVPGDSSSVTGIESNVNFLTVFTRDSLFAVSGEGPNAVGQGVFSQPSILANGQGALPGSPHLSHAFGTFYIADRGVYIVTPNGQVQYVGAPVEDLVDANTIKQITVFDHVNEIRFLADDGTSDAACYVYNTFFKQWYRWSIKSADDPVDQINYSATGGSADDTHYVLLKSGQIRRQSSTLYQDNSVSYDMVVTFRPIAANGLQGVQRIYRVMFLYDHKTTSSGSMAFAFDYDSSFTETHNVSEFLSTIPNNIRAHLSNQKCRAFKAKMTVTSTGEGIILNGLAIEVGAKPGTFKLPATQTVAPT
tara:strand:+ start:6310 stop:10053 length:3744 start_codon:yes stop_codon:yes gene_type:complete